MWLDMVSENAKTTNNYLIVIGTFCSFSATRHIHELGLEGKYPGTSRQPRCFAPETLARTCCELSTCRFRADRTRR